MGLYSVHIETNVFGRRDDYASQHSPLPLCLVNENLQKAILLYTVGAPKALSEFLEGLSKPTLVSTLIDFLTIYLNDKNSSRLRELVTLLVCGWEPYEAKLGYNGYRLTFPEGPREWCEVKPQNSNNPKKKLDGGGSFNDYTPERWENDKKANPTLLISGFVHGKLVYVLEAKFSCISEHLYQLLKKRFPETRQKGEYLRSASFSLKDYKDCEQLRLAYLRADWEAFADYLSRDLLNFLSQC